MKPNGSALHLLVHGLYVPQLLIEGSTGFCESNDMPTKRLDSNNNFNAPET